VKSERRAKSAFHRLQELTSHDKPKLFFLEEFSEINSLRNFTVTTCKPIGIGRLLRSAKPENTALAVTNPTRLILIKKVKQRPSKRLNKIILMRL